MSLATFRQRVIAILLFFKEYRVLIYCFTFFSFSLSSVNFLERVLFEQERVQVGLVTRFFLPALILVSIFFVSYRLFCHVHFFKTFFKIFLMTAFISVLILCLQFSKISKLTQKVSGFTGKSVWITGVVTSREKTNSYLFHSKGGGLGNSLARFEQEPDLHVGQRCKILAKVVQPKSFEEFDYRKYLFRRGIYSILEVWEYECRDGGNLFLEFRYRLERIVERSLPEPEASLLIGIMFGSKRIFMSDFNSALNSSGVSHIIAASGYNVALVAQFVDGISRKSTGKGTVFLKILLIWSFSIFSGLSSSLVRASTMSTISLIALMFGRDSNKAASLILCVTLLILINPFIVHDIGFLFSFVSVTGLMFLPKCFENIRSKFVKDSVLPTLTSILFTLPISVIFFGKISAISLLANIVVVPIVTSTIFWGLVSTVVNSFVSLKILFLVPYLQLNVFKQFVLLSSNIKMVEINVSGYVIGIATYATLFLFCLLKYPVSSDNYYLLQAKKV